VIGLWESSASPEPVFGCPNQYPRRDEVRGSVISRDFLLGREKMVKQNGDEFNLEFWGETLVFLPRQGRSSDHRKAHLSSRTRVHCWKGAMRCSKRSLLCIIGLGGPRLSFSQNIRSAAPLWRTLDRGRQESFPGF
jgi:hypothetical protein